MNVWPGELAFRLIMTLILVVLILGILFVALAAFMGGAVLGGVFFIVCAAIAVVFLFETWEWHGHT